MSKKLMTVGILLGGLLVPVLANAQISIPNPTRDQLLTQIAGTHINPAMTDAELLAQVKPLFDLTYAGPNGTAFRDTFFDELGATPLADTERIVLNAVLEREATGLPVNLVPLDNSITMSKAQISLSASGDIDYINALVGMKGDPALFRTRFFEEAWHGVQTYDLVDSGVPAADVVNMAKTQPNPGTLQIEIEAKFMANGGDLTATLADLQAAKYGLPEVYIGMKNLALTDAQQFELAQIVAGANGGMILPVDSQVAIIQDLPTGVMTGAQPLLQAAPGEIPPVIGTANPPPVIDPLAINPGTAAAAGEEATLGLGATLGGGATQFLGGVAQKMWLVQLIYEGGEGAIAWYTSGLAYPDDPEKANNYAWATFSGHLGDEVSGMAQMAIGQTLDPGAVQYLQQNVLPNQSGVGGLLLETLVWGAGLQNTVSAAVRSGVHEFFDTIFDVQPGDDGSLDGQLNPFGYSLQGLSTIQAFSLTQSQFPMYTGDYYTGGVTFNFAPVTTANAFAWNAGIQTGVIPAGTTFADYNGQSITWSMNQLASANLTDLRGQFQLLTTPSDPTNCAAYGVCGLPSQSGDNVLQNFQLLTPSTLDMTQGGTNYTFDVSSAWSMPQSVVYSNPVYNTVPDSVTSPFVVNTPLSTVNDPFARSWQPSVDLSVSPIITGFVTDPSVLQPLSYAFTNAIWNGDAQVGLTNGASIFSTPADGIGYFGNTGSITNDPSDYSDWENIPDTMSDGAWSDDD